MKWPLIVGGVALLVVLLTYAALDEADVVWNAGEPHCPHCRVVVPKYGSVCPSCRKAFEWVADERPCALCLEETEVDFLHSLSSAEIRARVEELGGTIGGLDADGVVTWIREIEPHECVFCAGTGDPMGLEPGSELAKLAHDLDDDCPVCAGQEHCVLCDGDGVTEYGHAGAHRVALEYQRRTRSERPLIGSYTSEFVANRFRRTVRGLTGYEEIGQVWFPFGTGSVIDAALARRDAILEAFRPATAHDER